MRNHYTSFFRVLYVAALLLKASFVGANSSGPADPRVPSINDDHKKSVTEFAFTSSNVFAVSANAGLDTTLPFSQMNVVTQLPLKGNGSGNISSWKWTKISGGNITIADPNAQNTLATGFQPGNYSFQLTVSDGVTSATDVINVLVVDYQKKGEAPCRSGAPVIWTLPTSANNTIFNPYLRRDGRDIRGGDTIKIPAGNYTGISLGDFGGSNGCPVVVVPAGQVNISGSSAYFRLGSGIGDSNFVSHVIIDGTYLQSKGIKYGFQFINGAPSPATIGFTANLVTDAEVSGLYLENTGVGVMAKLDSDSSHPYRVFNNFYMKNLKFHDIYIHRTTGEAMYLGHTSPQGDAAVQAGNDGPTVRIDSIEVNNVIIDSSGWDGIQVSNAIYASIHDNIIYRSGSSNVGSQRAWIIMGGNTTGKIYNNIGYNLKEGIRGTPYGNVEIYNNYGDSIMIGSTSDDGIYMTGIATGPGTNVLEPRALFKPYAHDNIFARAERYLINFPNSYGFNTPGQITNNDLIDPSKTLTQLIGSAGDLITNNTLFKSFPVQFTSTGSKTIGPRIKIVQLDSTNTFTDAASAIAWLRCRLTGACSTVKTKPTANAGVDQTIILPISLATLTGVGTGNGPLSYAWVKISGPSAFTIGAAASALTTVTGLIQGTYSFQLTVTDAYGQTAKDTVNIKVNGLTPNQPPVANAGSAQTITLPVSSVTLNGSASSDPDGTIASYAWSQVSGPSTATIGTAGAVTTVVNGLQAGQYIFQLTVKDNSGTTSTVQVKVTVNAVVNQPPVADAGSAQTITLPTSSVTLDGSGSSDPDGTIASYAWSQVSGPSTATIGAAGAVTTVVNGLQAGQYIFQLTVKDNSGTTSTVQVKVTVNAVVNQPPVANAGSAQTITLPTSSVTLDGSASSDPDGTIASYAWSQVSGPSTAAIGAAGAVTTVVSGLQAGQYIFQLTIKDNSGTTATAQVKVTVNGIVNQPPVANAGAAQAITLPVSSVTLDGSASSDPDGTIASYAWSQVSGPTTATLGTAGSVTTSAGSLVAGTYIFQLKVTDNDGATATTQVKVTVADAANLNPVANAGSNQTITLPTSSVTLNGSASSDPNGSISSYVWSQVSGPTTATMGTAGAVITTVGSLVAGTYVFELKVTDNSGATATDDVNVTVNAAANQAPAANAGANLSITLPTNSVTLNGSASSDPDGTIAGYAWSQVSGPTTATLGTAGAVSTTVGSLVQGNYVFRLTVTDNNGAKSTDDISVAVNAAVNKAPVANAGANLSITLPTSSVTLNGSASSDPDGTIAGYAWSQVSGPTTATLGTAGAVTTIAGGLVQGNYVFRLTVTDNDGAKSTDDISVVVNASVNKAPVANAGANLSITLPTSSVTLDGSASSDPDGTIASYAWSQVSGPSTATLGAAGAVSTSAGGLVQGNYVFRLTVTDNDGAKSTDDISVLVNPAPNKEPIANAGPSQNLVLPVSNVMLDGTSSYDPDGTIVSYSWLQVSGIGGVSITNSNTATPSLYGLKVGTYVFQLTVKDNAGAEASDQVSVVVSATGTPPPAAAVLTANAGTDTTVSMTANNGAVLNGSASSDAGGTITGYEWTQVSGPDGVMIASPASVTSLVSNLAVGVYVFQLTVTDDKGNRDSATVQVRVIDNKRNSSSLEIYPNPAHDIVNLKISDDNTGKVKITLFDMGGRIVKTEETDKTGIDLQTTINVSQLASGVYGVQIQIGTKTKMVSRVVKQ